MTSSLTCAARLASLNTHEPTLIQGRRMQKMASNYLVVHHRGQDAHRQCLKLRSGRAQPRAWRLLPLANAPRVLGGAIGLAVGCIGLLTDPAGSQAALLRYAASGTGISGTFAGEAFSNAAWEVFANSDSDDVQHLMIPTGPMQQIDAWLLKPVTPSLRLTWAGAQRTAQLASSSPFSWSILSGLFPVGPSPKIGFVYGNPSFSMEHAAGLVSLPPMPNPGLYNNLQAPVMLTSPWGTFEAYTYPTSAGDLVISSAGIQPGIFRIDPVPAPLPLLAVGSALGWSRQLRRRCRRRKLSFH